MIKWFPWYLVLYNTSRKLFYDAKSQKYPLIIKKDSFCENNKHIYKVGQTIFISLNFKKFGKPKQPFSQLSSLSIEFSRNKDFGIGLKREVNTMSRAS